MFAQHVSVPECKSQLSSAVHGVMVSNTLFSLKRFLDSTLRYSVFEVVFSVKTKKNTDG